MANAHDPWHLTQRQTQILEALTALVYRGQLPAKQVDDVEALYHRGLLFEAERVAAFAIWLATSPPQAHIQALPERLGVLVQAWHILSTTLVTMDQWELWRPYGDTLAAFQRDYLQVSSCFYTGLLHLSDGDTQPIPAPLAERGRVVRRVLMNVTARDPVARAPLRAPLGTALHHTLTLDAVTTPAQQIVDELLWLGRTLRAIRRWELWSDHASSYAVFLDDVLGLGSRLGFGLIGLAAAWETTRQPRRALGPLEMAVQIVIGQIAPATSGQRGVRP